jgi:hypothetical protein
LELCGKMRVAPRLCAVRKPEQKGKVERAIRYVRERFLAGRSITGMAEGNAQLARFIAEIAHPRPHPVLAHKTVGQMLSDERPRLLALGDPLPDTDRIEPISADRQAFIRFDTNRYSIPTDRAERALTLVADDVSVRVLDGATCIAQHTRTYGKRQVIEVPAHRAALIAERRAAADLKGRDRLRAVAPDFGHLLDRWVDSGTSLAIQVTRAIKLLDLYGDEVFAAAVTEIVERGLRDTGALALVCDRVRKERRLPVPVDIVMPAHADDRDVVPHDLGSYDDN